jgi:hypothetical protein
LPSLDRFNFEEIKIFLERLSKEKLGENVSDYEK